jgi:uncharacterized protein YutE (UPF0331/DUF86 family)
VTRAPLDASDPHRTAALKRKVLGRLTDMSRHYRAFGAAMNELDEGFSRERFVAAARSEDPSSLNRVKAIERGLDQLFNYVAELSALGLELAGLRTPESVPKARTDLRELQEIGVIEASLCEQLVRIAGIRNRMVHDYVEVSGDDVYEAVRVLHVALPHYIDAYQDWVRAGFAAPL